MHNTHSNWIDSVMTAVHQTTRKPEKSDMLAAAIGGAVALAVLEFSLPVILLGGIAAALATAIIQNNAVKKTG